MAAAAFALGMGSCTDDIEFGNEFLDKSPGSTVTIDTVFRYADYTEGFLANIYAKQYYGLPYNNYSTTAWSENHYNGKYDAVTDLYQLHWSSTNVYTCYYQAQLSSSASPLFSFTDDKVWETVRYVYQFLANVDQCEEISADLRTRYKAEAKCVLASRYFDIFMMYGGVPIITEAFTGTEGSYNLPRGTVEETVDFMVDVLDEAIPDLPWAYNGTTSETSSTLNRLRWSKAGAMALKAKILTFAASPVFNDSEAPYDGSSEAEQQNLVWYGDYSAERWTRALEACEDFFEALDANGHYALEQPSNSSSVNQCRLAYRKGYLYQTSTEPLHATNVRGYDNWSNGYYAWSNWVGLGRNSYLPTYEYMEMFPWSDGTAFDWDADQSKIVIGVNAITGRPQNGRLFYRYASTSPYDGTPSRDPRLYENAIVNGQPAVLDWTTGITSGNEYELWVGGYHAGQQTMTDQMTACYSSGFGVMKYHLGSEGSDYLRLPLQWVTLGLSEMYLMYAECLAQTGNLSEANNQVQVVRSRVGLTKSLSDNNSEVLTDKDTMIEEILRERACELGMSNNRYFDMIRYKRTDWMVKKLHGLRTYRQLQDASGNMVDNNVPYIGDEKNGGAAHPVYFRYEIFDLFDRVLWSYSADDLYVKKYLFSPFPQDEINKQYGLVQNPGW